MRMQVFAYGQTGSGKTHTMGTAATFRQMSSGEEGDGIIPRSMRFIFDSVAAAQDHYDVSLKVPSHPHSFPPICKDQSQSAAGQKQHDVLGLPPSGCSCMQSCAQLERGGGVAICLCNSSHVASNLCVLALPGQVQVSVMGNHMCSRES